jgi:hypothetical protein
MRGGWTRVIEQPSDQQLTAISFHATTDRRGDDPPVLHVVIDVEHVETGAQWRQELIFDRDHWVELMELLAYAAKGEGLKWKR